MDAKMKPSHHVSAIHKALTLAFTLLVMCRFASTAEPVFPGRTWSEKTPAEAGLDKSSLDALAEYAGGMGCVVRNGCMVYSWGDPSRRQDVASAAKPFYSHFLFQAVEDGRIESLDAKVVKWEPRLADVPDGEEIEWRHMANQTSCYGLTDKPGEAYAYNDWQMALFFDTLFLKVYGATWENVDEKVFHPMLTDILQCEDNPTFMAFGTGDRAGRVRISPRDFARFGLLYLHKGNWNGRQLVSRKHAETAVTSPLPNSIPRASGEAAPMIPGQRTIGSQRIPDNQTDHMGSYSWLWWTNGVDREGKRHWPDVRHDAYGAFGHGGPRAMVVIPSLDMIVSWNDTKIRGRELENEALRLATEAAK